MPSQASACGRSERPTTSTAATTAKVRIGSVARRSEPLPDPERSAERDRDPDRGEGWLHGAIRMQQ
jgi:hypothetical protein